MTGVAYGTAPDWTNGQGGYPTTALSVTRELGLRHYELANHLGNVLSTVSDRRLAVASGSLVSYYRADEKSYADYDPYGMLLPGRFGGGFADQNFGFQGQLKDDELNSSVGTSYAFEYRVHDPRVGRFLSVDPLAQKYPYYSFYAFSGNRVIDMIEFEGLEPDAPTGNWILEDNQGDKYGRGCQILLVSTTSSDVIWELARYQIGNSVVWMYADRSKAPGEQWSRFWPKTGTSEVQTQQYVFSWPGQVNNRESDRLKLLGQHDAELGGRLPNMMSKGIFTLTLTLTTAGVGGPGVDMLMNGGEQLMSNGRDWRKLDLFDMSASALPAYLEIPLSATLDYTLEGERGKFKSVFDGDDKAKSRLNAAVEGGWSLLEELNTYEHLGSSSGKRLVGFLTGVASNLGADQFKHEEKAE
jgi:RHS repeat-associated protein